MAEQTREITLLRASFAPLAFASMQSLEELRVDPRINLMHIFQIGTFQMLGTIVIVVLLLLLLGAWPAWPHSRDWGYYPSGTLGILLIVILVLALSGRI